MRNCIYIFLFLMCNTARSQDISSSTGQVLDSVFRLQLLNRTDQAIAILEKAIATSESPNDLAYLYAYQSGLHTSMDSLLKGKRLLNLGQEAAERANTNESKAVVQRAKAYLNYGLNLPDSVVKDALTGLKYLEGNPKEPATKYHLNYLLYSIYSKWGDEEKMEKYILRCQQNAIEADNINLQANVNNGLASMYLTRYRKNNQSSALDSCLHYLKKSFGLHESFPEQVSGDTFVITCINLANYYLGFATGPLDVRQEEAFGYLHLAEEKLQRKEASSEKWINVLGIKSSFAKKAGNSRLAEQYLLQGLNRLMEDNGTHFKLEYRVNKELSDIAAGKNDPKSALAYQKRAETLLKRSFDEEQLRNAQKLEVQFEMEKKEQELSLLKERGEFQKKQNYLYGSIAIALLFGLVFMFISYHFKLRYSREREDKLKREKQEGVEKAELKLKMEREERSRLKAEQELLEIKSQQLEKESLANSLLIEYKNDMLQQIKSKIKEGDTGHIQKLLKEEMLLTANFEDIKIQIQKVHPDFFNRLNQSAVRKLTSLDLKYCTYLYLKMSTKQIARTLHVEPQSVRMSKYRLKQKFGLGKDDDLEVFLSQMN